jgi:hypothetical protein
MRLALRSAITSIPERLFAWPGARCPARSERSVAARPRALDRALLIISGMIEAAFDLRILVRLVRLLSFFAQKFSSSMLGPLHMARLSAKSPMPPCYSCFRNFETIRNASI